MIDWITLVPAAVLAAAGLAIVLDRDAFSPQRQRGVEVLAWLGLLSAAAVVGILGFSGRVSLHMALSPWSDAVFTGDPGLDVDLLAATCVLGVTVLALLSVMRAGRVADRRAALGGSLFVAAASALFIAAARTPLGLVSTWLLLDAALFFGAGIGRRGLLSSQLGLLLALAGLMDLPIGAETVDAAALSDWTRAWLVGAATVRMGLYPLWWSVPRTPDGTMWRAFAGRLAPMLAGAYLLFLATPAAGAASVPGLVLGSLGTVFGAILAWGTRRVGSVLDWTTVHVAGLVVVAACLPGPYGRPAALILLFSLAVPGAALYLVRDAPSLDRSWVARLAPWSMLGAPLGAGFLGRWLLLEATAALDTRAVWAVVALSPVPAVARWLSRFDRRPEGAPAGRWPGAWLGLAMLAQAAVGLGGLWVLVTGQSPVPGWSPPAMPIVSRAAVAGLLLPFVLGPLLRTFVPRRPIPEPSPHEMARAVRLTELFDGLRTVFIRAGRLAHDRLGLAESRRAMAWTVLAGLTTGLAFLGPPSLPGEGPLPVPAITLSFVASGAVAGVLLLAQAPMLSLAALAGGYGVLAGELFLHGADGPVPMGVLALIKLVAGVVVVAILTISWTQSEQESRTAAAGRRLAALRRSGPAIDDRGLAAISLALAWVVALGVPSVTVPESLASPVLHSALVLVAGGVLTGIFARTALRLACGVLLAMCGFELIYAFLEPGLVITAGLAVFQIVFAIVASAFVGHDDVAEEAA